MTAYKTAGVCSSEIQIEIEEVNGEKIVKSAMFVGGCAGNTSGISKLVKGMPVDEVIRCLEGIPCGMKQTSCPDQLARALKQLV